MVDLHLETEKFLKNYLKDAMDLLRRSLADYHGGVAVAYEYIQDLTGRVLCWDNI